MSQTVGDFVIQRLHHWGVRHLFSCPGNGINGVSKLAKAISRISGRPMTFLSVVAVVIVWPSRGRCSGSAIRGNS
jgi:hypothetical protein